VAEPNPLAVANVMQPFESRDTPESRNHIALTPGTNALPAPVIEEPLVHLEGGLPTAILALRPRIIAVPGPGCTLMGLARSMLSTFNSATPRTTAGGPLTDLELAQALFAYNRRLLGFTVVNTLPLLPLPNWRVGLLLTLPMEVAVDRQVWVTNILTIRTLAATVTAEEGPMLGQKATPLSVPDDPNTIKLELPPIFGYMPTLQELITQFRNEILTNPFDTVFRTIVLLRELRAVRPAEVYPFVIELFESLVLGHAQALGQCTAGNALLRQFQLVLDGSDLVAAGTIDPAKELRTRTILAAGLGLSKADGPLVGTAWKDMRTWGPSVIPEEIPLTVGQLERKDSHGNLYLQEMSLGRIVDISKGGKKQGVGWVKLSYSGDTAHETINWLDKYGNDPDIDRAISTSVIAPLLPYVIEKEKVRARLQVAARIAGSEGGLDSCQAGDGGIVSFGLQQWAAHNEQEFTVLLERFRIQAPDHFDLFFGMAGLQTVRWAGTWTNPGLAPDKATCDAANPFGPDPSGFSPADIQNYMPFFATFLNVKASEAAEYLPHQPKKPRNDFFRSGKRAGMWCARARLAALCSREFLRVQLQQAAWRFTRIEHEDRSGTFQLKPQVRFKVPSAIRHTELTVKATVGATSIKVHTGKIFSSRGGYPVLCEREILLCTASAGGVLTVLRGQEGTVAVEHPAKADIRRIYSFATIATALNDADLIVNVTNAVFIPGTTTVRLLCEQEIILCTVRTANSITIVRGREGTVPAAHAAGTMFYRLDGDAVLTAVVGDQDADTAIRVSDVGFLPAGGSVLLMCEDEVLSCSAVADNVLTVARGQEGTVKKQHPIGAPVFRVCGYSELFTSEFSAGTVLDYHINQPGFTIPIVEAAIERTLGDTHAADGSLNEPWLRRFAVDFLAARIQNPDGSQWINEKDRNSWLLSCHDIKPRFRGQIARGLSPDPHTFIAWKRSKP